MRTFSLLKGQPVFDSVTGKTIGVVSDLQVSDEGSIEAVIVDVKGFFERDRFIHFNDILSFGKDGVMINKETLHTGFTKTNHYLCHHHGLLGQLLYTTEGEKLGIVDDVYFDENLGTIVGYEVSEGFFADLSEGKRVINSKHPLQFGEDIVMIEIDT
ncbi:PRC-barrel domain-containing protein [Bacillus pinisoli]|uniref:PRC-barrel domain-containing protein n=1 Tax=Bacillus pinisoli TaxID=2901866 RepID=UPI001FF3482E|nr:PRC-barrel domain-containing protein [Bacillus pinisoli]